MSTWKRNPPFDLTKRKFKYLKVLRRVIPSSKQIRASAWLVRCCCGKEWSVTGSQLRSGGTTSCGCIRTKRVIELGKASALPYGVAARNALLFSYKRGAKVRGLAWEIPEELFDGLVKSNCHYCTGIPSNVFKRRKGLFVYNGIDRKDNSIGYTPENSVPCCDTCNRMKGTMTENEFRQHVHKIAVAPVL